MNDAVKSTLIVFFCSAWPFANFLYSNAAELDSINRVLYYGLSYVAICLLVLTILRFITTRFRFPYFSKLSLPSLACVVGMSSLAFMTYHLSTALLSLIWIERILYQHIGWIMYFSLLTGVGIILSRYRSGPSVLLYVSGALFLSALTQYTLSDGVLSDRMTERKSNTSIEGASSQTSFVRTPSIFHVILDEYARSDVIEEQTGFNNSAFIAAMEQRGFVNIEQANANYGHTDRSIASLLNMDLIYPVGPDGGNRGTMDQTMTVTGNGAVIKALRNEGYKYLFASADHEYVGVRCDKANPGGVDYCVSGIGGVDELQVSLLSMTPLLRALQILFPKAMVHNLLKLSHVMENYPMAESAPVFSFAHIWQPHAPLIYLPDCSLRKETPNPEWNRWGNALWLHTLDLDRIKRYYVENVQCANKRTIEYVDWITTHYPDAIIALTGDHGSYFTNFDKGEKWTKPLDEWTDAEFDERLSILSLIRLPEQCRDTLYPTMTLSNTYRVILACLKDEKPDLLPDQLYRSTYEGPDYVTILPYRDMTPLRHQAQ